MFSIFELPIKLKLKLKLKLYFLFIQHIILIVEQILSLAKRLDISILTL
mgnify:CR=1 FL=1|jgi:hypothetical protein